MEKSNNGYSKAYNCSQSQYKSFNTLQTGGQIAWEGNGESGGKKGRYTLLIYLKCFYFLGRKSKKN